MSNSRKESKPGKPGRKPSAPKKQRAGRAGANLRRAVDKLVSENTEKIAQALVNQTIAGNMAGARLVTALTGAEKPPTQPKKSRAREEKTPARKWPRRTEPSMALRLAMEPPWEGLTPEERERSIAANGLWCHNCNRPRPDCLCRPSNPNDTTEDGL
jgi:hypothetical protein